MLNCPLFQSWRTVWEGDSETKELAQEVDRLAAERNKGNFDIPTGDWLRRFGETLTLFKRLYDDVAEHGPAQEFQFYRAYAAYIISLQPLVDVARWPRWIYLERMLNSASRSGDLLVGALALRTQIEDLRVQRELCAYEAQLPEMVDLAVPCAVDAVACRRIRDHATLFWARFLPMMAIPLPDEMIRPHNMPDRRAAESPHLTEAFDALNDYVHPNYGSHACVIWPERAAAGTVLLKAFNLVYHEFLSQAWPQIGANSQIPVSVPNATTSASEVARFVEITLPEMSRTLQEKHGYAKEWAPQPLHVFRDSLKHDQKWSGQISDSGEGETFRTWLGPFCDTTEPAGAPHGTEDIATFPLSRTGFGLPGRLSDWIQLAFIRRLAARMDREMDQLSDAEAFPAALPCGNWAAFIRTSLEFSVLLATLKINAMRDSTMRMLNDRNPLGAVLCARSLIEHYTVAAHLSENFRVAWQKVEDAARSGRDVRPPLDQLESDVGRFLAGTKRTAEVSTRWRQRWALAGRARHLNLEAAIKKCYEQKDYRQFLYDWFSRIVHGDALYWIRPLGTRFRQNIGKTVCEGHRRFVGFRG